MEYGSGVRARRSQFLRRRSATGSTAPDVSGQSCSAARWWSVVVLAGVVAGLIGIAITELLHLVQHIAFGYTEDSFLHGVEQASPGRRLARPTARRSGGRWRLVDVAAADNSAQCRRRDRRAEPAAADPEHHSRRLPAGRRGRSGRVARARRRAPPDRGRGRGPAGPPRPARPGSTPHLDRGRSRGGTGRCLQRADRRLPVCRRGAAGRVHARHFRARSPCAA